MARRMAEVLMDIVRYDSGSGTWAGKIFEAKGQIWVSKMV